MSLLMNPPMSSLMLWELILKASSASPLNTFGAFAKAVITSRSAPTSSGPYLIFLCLCCVFAVLTRIHTTISLIRSIHLPRVGILTFDFFNAEVSVSKYDFLSVNPIVAASIPVTAALSFVLLRQLAMFRRRTAKDK